MKDLTIVACGPSTVECRCQCIEGKGCDHDFCEVIRYRDPETGRETGGGLRCAKCGLDNMAHDLWVLP